MVELRWGSATDSGRVRSVNQDTVLVLGDRSLFAVADGMGGHQGGEVASRTAIETLDTQFTDATLESLIEAVEAANTTVFEQGGSDPSLHGMGTTIVAVALIEVDGEERIAIANVGDSRVYLFDEGELVQLTDDHSLVADMVREGRLTPEEAENHPQRNIVTRVIGIYEVVQVDHEQVLPFAGQRFLLASDGLFNEVSSDQIAGVLRRLADPQDAARELVRLANEGGGRDNISVVLVDVVDDGGRASAASSALAGEKSKPAAGPDMAGFSTALDDDVLEKAFKSTDAEPTGRRARRRAAKQQPRPRRFTWRVALFVFVVLAVLGGAASSVVWYARASYFVGVDGAEVAIYKGRPDGLLWFDPTLEKRTGIPAAEIPAAFVTAIEKGKEEATLKDAEAFVANLKEQIDKLNPPPTTTTTTTTAPATVPTTTAAPPN